MRKIYTAITMTLFALSSFANQGISSVQAQVNETLGTDFLEFTIADQVSGTVINTVDHTLLVTMPFGSDVTALVADFKLSTGAIAWVGDIKQVTGTTANDFTSPVTYTVKNNAKSEQAWVVSVAIEEPVTVTFNVDLSSQGVNAGDYWILPGDVFYVTGSYDGVESWGWDKPGTGASVLLDDSDGDLIYTGTIETAKNSTFEYKYFLGASWDKSDGFTNDHPDNNRTAVVGEDGLTTDDVWVAIVNKPIGVQEKGLELVSMYPNPVSNQLTIANLDGVSKVTLSNLLGQALVSKNVTNAKMTINTAELKAGIYVVTLVSQNGSTRSERIVKE